MQKIDFANSFTVTGVLENAPKLDLTKNGTAYCRTTIDVTEDVPNGEARTLRLPVVAFRAAAVAMKDLVKGAVVTVTGQLRGRAYTGQDGIERLNLDAVIDQVAVAE